MRFLLGLAALTIGCAAKQPAVAARDPDREVFALLQGLGPTVACQDDRGCQVGPVAGACGLGTCFGLLTTDQRPLRKILVERIGHADAILRPRLQARLLETAGKPDLGNSMRQAVLEGIGALWMAGGCRDVALQAAVVAQVNDDDPRQAITARLAAGHCGHPAALPGLLEDLATGTEQLRAESAAALGGYGKSADGPKALAALLQLLRDPSPVVLRAAVMALHPWQADPSVAAQLATAVQTRAPHLDYLVQRQAGQHEAP